MVHVVATITLKPGARQRYLPILKANVPLVLAEAGCHGYAPLVDLPSGIAVQGAPRPDVVTIVEQWESLEHLHTHLAAPHMAAYREKAKDLVQGVGLQVLQPA
jgi:quinol monooxygenase YgiN